MAEYVDIYYESEDGLTLYARDYQHPAPTGTVLCLHGLTRNSADFEDLADHLAADYRVIVADQRGRGLSEPDPDPGNYQPAVYVQDMFRLLSLLELDRVILVGTSMGGLMSMIMASLRPDLPRAVVLNDIGPEVDPAGLARIQGYVGRTAPVNDWADAVAVNKSINGQALPDLSESEWLRFTRALFREDERGRPVPAYDPAIARPMQGDARSAVPPDLWPVFDALEDIPALVIRGAMSDILAPDCVAEMQRRKPDLRVAEIPNRGHAPLLNEPACLAAIDALLRDLG